MARGAPNRKDLDYFPKMVNFYEDDKIFDLLDEYGPLGVTIYDCILTVVYANGYYANLSKDKLSRMVIRKIGNKWIKSQKVVVQVIDYCADLGLFQKDLMLQNIITSVGIQKRYYKVAVKLMKRQLYSTEYWMLDQDGNPLLNSPQNRIPSEENQIPSEENDHPSEASPIKRKETKRNERKNRQEPEQSPASDGPGYAAGSFEMQCVETLIKSCREAYAGSKVPDSQGDKEKWADEIGKMKRIDKRTEEEIKAALEYAVTSPFWKSNIRSTKKFREKFETLIVQQNNKAKDIQGKDRNRFHNFEQRQDVDYESMIWSSIREEEESGE